VAEKANNGPEEIAVSTKYSLLGESATGLELSGHPQFDAERHDNLANVTNLCTAQGLPKIQLSVCFLDYFTGDSDCLCPAELPGQRHKRRGKISFERSSLRFDIYLRISLPRARGNGPPSAPRQILFRDLRVPMQKFSFRIVQVTFSGSKSSLD
jgi:hypothetical protein